MVRKSRDRVSEFIKSNATAKPDRARAKKATNGSPHPPSFEPRPLFLSGRGSKLGTPTAAQKHLP
jgi:hypothetical protein